MVEPIAGVVAKVLTPLATSAVQQSIKSVWQYLRAPDSTLPSRTAIAGLATWLQEQFETLPAGERQREILISYVGSAECVTLLEHVVAFRMTGRSIATPGPLPRELSTGLSIYGDLPADDVQSLFTILLSAVDQTLGPPIRSAEQVDAASREESYRRSVEVFLSSIDAQISMLSSPPEFDPAEVGAALTQYHRTARRVLGQIQPPNFDGAVKVDLDRLYVLPRFTGARHRRARELSLSDVRRMRRCVVLGDPGGGKTTLGKKIAVDMLAGAPHVVTRNTDVVTPFVVVLREFGAYLKARGGRVADFIADQFSSIHQISLDSRAVDWLLTTGRLFIVFDGLDELLDTTYRTTIVEVIEAFATRYANSRVLVTSRRVGYLAAPLPDSMFTSVLLGDFGAAQIREYVGKWFALDPEIGEDQRNRLTTAFLEESELVADLRENPLMLALMCTIYRAEGYIPRNRPDVYEKCATMLFDNWDRHRGLLDPLEFEAHVEPALMHLAHLIYETGRMQTGITERELIAETANYLQRWQYEDRATAEHAARKFVRFCRGRAWVFTDIGLTAEHEPLYQFVHQTFLEYFTAAHLARSMMDVQDLCTHILRRVERGEWEVVAQLALQIKAKTFQGGADLVMSELLNREQFRHNSIRSRANILGFVARSLAFLTISPAVSRQVAAAVVAGCVSIRREQGAGRGGMDMGLIWPPLGRVTREVRATLFDAVAAEITAGFQREHWADLPENLLGLAWSLVFEVAPEHTSPAFDRLREACEQALVVHALRWPYKVRRDLAERRRPDIAMARHFWLWT